MTVASGPFSPVTMARVFSPRHKKRLENHGTIPLRDGTPPEEP